VKGKDITMNKIIFTIVFGLILFCSSLPEIKPIVNADENLEWTVKWQTNLTYLPTVGDRTDTSIAMPVLYDVTGDGTQEVFVTKGYGDCIYYPELLNKGDVWCLNGTTGAVQWHFGPMEGIGNHAVMSIHDLNEDGHMELLVCGYHRTVALVADTTNPNGEVLWNVTDPDHRHDKPALVLKLGTTPESIFIYTCMDTYGAAHGIEKRLRSTGTVVDYTTAPIEHPCYGGLSAADINDDGEIEILLGDRSTGVGLACFDTDLNLLWDFAGDVACSTQAPMIVPDLNDNGGLDVVVANQRTQKICIVDGKTHTKITPEFGSIPSTDGDIFVSPIYDTDKDGRLEYISGEESQMFIYDLGTQSLDATLICPHSDGYYYFPPQIANVWGNSDMEIVNRYGDRGIDVFEHISENNYSCVYTYNDGIDSSSSACTTIIDMDNDGYNEIIELCDPNWSNIMRKAKVINTEGEVISPKATAKDQFYTYKRNQVSLYSIYDDPDITPENWTLTVSVPEGHGNVTKQPDKIYYQTGDIVTLHAIADPHWMFDHWSGDLQGNINPVTIVINSNMTISAYFAYTNNPPYRPQCPSGPISGENGINYNYTTNTTDPDGDQIYYKWDWGDGNISNWIGSFTSGEIANAQHRWETEGLYQIKVKAKDVDGAESNWSEPLIMTINPTYNLSVEIQGGFGVTATIKNIGDTEITNVQWKFTLTGGLIILGKTKTGTIASLTTGASTTIKDSPILGFGKTTIKVDITCAEGASRTQTKTGTIVLFFVLELQ
jgi:glycosyltransferase involved in cell wall biosynthesis